jgi:hypothetical protein
MAHDPIIAIRDVLAEIEILHRDAEYYSDPNMLCLHIAIQARGGSYHWNGTHLMNRYAARPTV